MTGIIIALYFTLSLSSFVSSSDVAYLNVVCNETAGYVGSSHRLQSSTKLYYEPNVACFYSVAVDSGKNVMLLVSYFDLESEVSNVCVDFVNIHDGSSTSDTQLNGSPLCSDAALANYTSTGNTMTVWFQTDSTGARLGFGFMFVAVTTAPCMSSQFACSNNVCIDSSLECSINDECGDNTDEQNCSYDDGTGLQLSDHAALLIGLAIGLFIAAIVGFIIGLWCWQHNRWHVFAKRPLTAKDVIYDETTFATAYPVTKVYYKSKYQDMYSDPEKPTVEYGSSTVHFSEHTATSTKQDVHGDQ